MVIASAAYCLYLIFAKKHAIVNFATAHYLILAFDAWLALALEKAIPDTPADPSIGREVIRGIVIACIWIPYFHFSKRVKNTFKETTTPTPPDQTGDQRTVPGAPS
jgi:hypothetical protein